MARRKKKKSGFQKLTIIMAWLMAFITLAAIVAQVAIVLVNNGTFG
ncbi:MULTISPECIES: DUF4044 domain-containing protein [unclassified Lactobacillus]|nr:MULTISPECIES: DUF4044 domain-containing protein [unclassified Lactobacillus]MDF7668446.1 DUF4044 domain-containing protein [Lactobacillus sp. ESL0703]WEV39334.1 DUF4044 domain-containing protein [Lactobacillus sp. ESL0680]